ncbi:lipid II-degrading bacteriocin [Pseudomonas tussilaginis]|nr:lipid II-degrading bacteriocin [Pseudomonas sp. 5]KJK09024.1 hypothetical protein UB47_04820 [Pseudomonas sp. 5]
MQIQLPPTIVYPDDYGTPSSSGGQAVPGHPLVIARIWTQRDEAYLSGNWWAMFCLDIKRAQYNRPPYSLGLMSVDLLCAHHADQLKATTPGISNSAAWQKGRSKATTYGADKSKILTTETLLSGDIFTPLKAFAHFIYGKGATATVPLEKTRLSPSPQKIPELQKMIDSAAIGKTEIDIRVNYDTFQDSFNTGAYLGNITLRIIGTIERNKEGKVTFSGQARAYNDIYDGNASTHRQIWAETLTTALRLVGEKNKATHYEIELLGSIPITYSN